MKRAVFVVMVVVLLLMGVVMPVSAYRGYVQPLVPPVEQPEGTIRLTGELTGWPIPVYDLYRYGGLGIEIEYYGQLDGVYRKAPFGSANIYREGGHFYYWLDVLPDDPTTEELEGPSALGEGANFVYKWARHFTASSELGKVAFDLALKYTPDPDPQGALPRVVIQDLYLHMDVR